MDNREDPGQYYPGGSVVPARPEPAAHPVESVNGHAGNVVLNASDVGALPDTTAIPTADTVSGWGFLRKTWANLTAAFASITHTHTKSNITDFAHGHSQSDVTGLTTALAGKQAELVSGTNIKTVNGQSLLGSGNIVVQGGGTPEDYDTVKSNAETGATHAAVTNGNPHGVTYQNIGGTKPSYTADEVGALASSGTAVNSLSLGGVAASSYALSASVPTAVSQLTDADDYLKKSGGTMTGGLGIDKGGDAISIIPDAKNTRYFSNGIARDRVVEGVTQIGYYNLSYPASSGTLALTTDIKTKTSQLTNDSGFVTADEVSAPDAHLEVANENLKVIGENDSTLWQSAGAVRYTKATTEAVALLDMTVNPYTLSAASGTTFSMPSASVAGKIRDFILDITNPLSTEATIQLAGDETTYKFVGVGGVSVTDCLKFAAGESALVSFTERALTVNGKVSFVVTKRVVA